jgi:uncharacterized coiled-coil protein SlyX
MSKKFLDSAGVSTLWARIKAELEPQQQAINTLNATVGEHTTTIGEHTAAIADHASKIAALEAGTYDDTEIRNLIGGNTAAIETLNGDAETAGSVAHTATAIAAAKVAEIVAGANASYDTLKEIADWILNDTTGAADMANDIAALQAQMAGIDATVVAHVAAEIEAALKVDGADKYALASDLTALADRVKALEDAGYQTADQVNTAIASKVTELNLAENYESKGAAATAESNAKAYADSLAKNYDATGSAAAAEAAAKAYSDTNLGVAKSYSDTNLATAKTYSDTNLAAAKTYTDTAVAGIVAMTNEEINAAIEAAING